MLTDDHLRLLVHLNDEQSQRVIGLVPAPAPQYPPELLSVDGVVGLLEVDEGGVVPLLPTLSGVDLSEELGYVGGRGGALLEARLVHLGVQEVGGQRGDLGHDGLLHDFGQVGPHHDWSDNLQLRLVKALVLRERYESSLIEVVRDRKWVVKEAEDLGGGLLCQVVGGVSRSEDGAVEAVWA